MKSFKLIVIKMLKMTPMHLPVYRQELINIFRVMFVIFVHTVNYYKVVQR